MLKEMIPLLCMGLGLVLVGNITRPLLACSRTKPLPVILAMMLIATAVCALGYGVTLLYGGWTL